MLGAVKSRSLPLDTVDLISGPVFVGTMLWEARALRERGDLRDPTDIDDWTREQLADPSPTPDALEPIGYEARDTRASLSMLVGNVAANIAVAAAVDKISQTLFRHRVVRFRSAATSMAAAMVLWDFLYYWDHRWQHEHRIFWANHVTHHSSRYYNLSTALRQPWSPFLLAWVFFPMPLLGIPPRQVAKAGQLNLLYQYWIHTEAIDRLPKPFEAVFNTPSHHRVHHGVNPQYLDKNHGGILIVWDKLFGTFEPEVRKVKYGLTKNVESFNPFVIGYHEFADIARDVRRAKGWRNKVRHLWNRPGWQPTP